MAKSKKTSDAFDMADDIRKEVAAESVADACSTSVPAIYSLAKGDNPRRAKYDKNADVIGYNLRLPANIHRLLKRHCMETNESMNNVVLVALYRDMKNWEDLAPCPHCGAILPVGAQFCPDCGMSENTALWEKVFMAADKGMAMIEDGGNYGDFLLKTIENAKDQFTEEELTLLTGEATKIKDIENQRAELETKYPWLSETPDSDDNTSVPAGSDMTTPPDDGSMQKFPAFEGKDLDGNTVKSSELFAKNAVTVVNFWFTTCNPCVGELGELDALNKELAEKGGALIGVNTFTLDGNETAISEAKDVLAKKGATYQNVYFASDGEAGKFTTNIFAYPTTYVVDRNGNIVGDPIVGAITEKKQAEALQAQIDKALSADRG